LNWILNENILTNRLLINGRLLTYNTRGWSLKIAWGNTLVRIHDGTQIPETPTGFCANGASIVWWCDWRHAASRDLERFRRILPDGDTTCSLYVTNNIPARKPDILTTIID
jgi:hypothetical protein